MARLADRSSVASPIRTLLAGAIDYAGLFPPASLPMVQAVKNYASYRESGDGWALGRFVVPVARLGELSDRVRELSSARREPPWRLSALAAGGGADEWPVARALTAPGLVVDAFELRCRTGHEIEAAAAGLPADVEVFYEIPIDDDPDPLIAVLARVGGRAKVRTGGVTADAFPSPGDLARFIVSCGRAGVAFKATAGLHHPIRASYRLTYQAASPTGEMFGFLNVLLGAAFAREGMGTDAVAELLGERDASAFRFGASGVEWRGRRVSHGSLAATRSRLALSFGSCSFREPIDELESLGLL